MVKNKVELWSLLIFGILLMLAMLLINLHLPTEVQAGPLAGFTPSPNDDDDGDSDGAPPPATESDKPEGRVPTDYVIVQLSQCDFLNCAIPLGDSEQTRYEPLAFGIDDTTDIPLLVPIIPKVAAVEVIAPVQLVHDGSGFIATGALSTHHNTRFTVPYPGQWEVFLTGQPQLVTAEAINMSRTNLAQLQAQLPDTPVSMGMVQANIDAPQTVKCPIECVFDPPPPVPNPEFLPETGDDDLLPAGFLLMIGFILVIIGITSRRAIRK